MRRSLIAPSVHDPQLLIYSPICPQLKGVKSAEEALIGVADDLIPKQNLKQDEFECLNLNVTCPAGVTPQSRLPVMLWLHG